MRKVNDHKLLLSTPHHTLTPSFFLCMAKLAADMVPRGVRSLRRAFGPGARNCSLRNSFAVFPSQLLKLYRQDNFTFQRVIINTIFSQMIMHLAQTSNTCIHVHPHTHPLRPTPICPPTMHTHNTSGLTSWYRLDRRRGCWPDSQRAVGLFEEERAASIFPTGLRLLLGLEERGLCDGKVPPDLTGVP